MKFNHEAETLREALGLEETAQAACHKYLLKLVSTDKASEITQMIAEASEDKVALITLTRLVRMGVEKMDDDVSEEAVKTKGN